MAGQLSQTSRDQVAGDVGVSAAVREPCGEEHLLRTAQGVLPRNNIGDLVAATDRDRALRAAAATYKGHWRDMWCSSARRCVAVSRSTATQCASRQ